MQICPAKPGGEKAEENAEKKGFEYGSRKAKLRKLGGGEKQGGDGETGQIGGNGRGGLRREKEVQDQRVTATSRL